MVPGGYNAKSSPSLAKFIEDYKRKNNCDPDYWGQAMYYAALQHFQSAIELAGTLDQTRIRDTLAGESFDTIIGSYRYVDNINTTHPGEIAQWQKGVFEVISPETRKTADPIFPKPAWIPKQP
jgi:branched-chain amino acid transport system substrate-binding protein